jgi:hypothetical protein
MATAQEYAQWIVDNQDKQGTAEFDTVAEAYKLAKAPKSASDKFAEPFKDVSIKDWSEKSLLAPMLQTMKMVTPFGMLRPDLAVQDLKSGSQNLVGKGKQMAQGAYQIATNPVESAQKAYTAVTENPAGVAGEMVKGALYDPELLIGSGLGNVAEKGLKTVGSTVSGVGDIVTGAIGTGVNAIAKPGITPRGIQVPSQRNRIGNTFVEPEDFAQFTQAKLPYGQLPPELPIGNLPKNSLDRAALMMSGGTIPNAGQGARAFGERIGETYRNPYTAAADIGSIFLTGGVPVLTAGRAGLGLIQGLADMRLASKGFTPNLPKILDEYKTGVRPMPGIQPGPMPRGFQAAGAVNPPPTPQAMAAAQINPAAAQTPAAQAAVNTTQAKAQKSQFSASGNYDVNTGKGSVRINTPLGPMTVRFGKDGQPIVEPIVKPQTAPPVQTTGAAEPLPPSRQLGYTQPTMYVAPEGVAGTNLRQVEQTALQQRYAPQPIAGAVAPQPEVAAPIRQAPVYKDAGQMRKALIGKVTPDEMDRLVREKFPAVEAPTKTTGSLFENSAPKVVTAEQQAKRDAFVNVSVKKHMEGMRQGRANNKEIYAEQAEAMRKMAAENKAKGKKDSPMYGRYSEGQNMNPKDVFTERKAVADMVYSVSKTNVTSKNKDIIVKRQGYNQMADDIGITLDWNTAPQAGKTIKETRRIMDKWMMDTINKELPDLGLYKRAESNKSISKRMEAEFEAEQAKLTPEQRTASLAEDQELLAAAEQRRNNLLRKEPSTPKTTTPIETEAARPEGVPEPAKLTKEQLLEMIAKRKGK